MNKIFFPLLAALPVLLTSCATTPPPPPQVYRSGETPALVIDSLDEKSSRILLPDITKDALNDATLAQAKKLGQQPAAVVILENFHENRPGDEFRDRSVAWYVSLRNLGYERIVFLHGNGTPNPEGLITIAKYD
ncbi:MAG TPA: hypothetical protein VL863_09815 [bacterium]|jgi:hypothetical protein|nr:hypothetical protein [bacterium]